MHSIGYHKMLRRTFIGSACCSRAQSRPSLTVHASFSFAASKRAKQPQPGRRNRAVEKRQENQLRNIVHGLCKMSGKQLQAVSHLLSEEQIKEIKIAMDIPPTNQGRRRQEGLVVKLLRAELDSLDLSKLSEAVTVAERNNLPFTDSDVEQQLQYWVEGLLDYDQDVNDEVYQLLQQHGLDWQQLRTWVRQVQQHKQDQQQQQQQPDLSLAEQVSPGSRSSSSSDSNDPDSIHQAAVAALHVQDDEVRELMLELAQQQQSKQRQRQQQRTAGNGKAQSSSSANAARRSIRRMLKPLAVEICT